ncbi:MAG TPA: NUDIX hydrolase [Thermomicrobiales bacterium]|nr:NUDIX hydrolase [Thermomicrobiales bacterium]
MSGDVFEPAHDGEQLPIYENGLDVLVSWHPATRVPAGTPHGATAICLIPTGQVVLVRTKAGLWSLPGGRPEPGETWEDTLRREVREEACAEVTQARLLGFGRGECIRGRDLGKVLVRGLWLASVDLLPWVDEFEMLERRSFPAAEARTLVRDALAGGHKQIITRMFQEAGLV